MGDSMPLITAKSGREMLASWTYDILSVLPDKFARFLFEFHAHRFESLNLPFLSGDTSDFDVHCALLDDKVHEYVILLTLILSFLWKCVRIGCYFIHIIRIMHIMHIITYL
jgi:hypothetical protein